MCAALAPTAQTELLHSRDLDYLGAFLLPDGDEFAYCQGIKAYNPDGDPHGPADGFPGSLFGTGHVWYSEAYEVTIPAPVDSRNVNDLPEADVLQAPVELVTQIELSVDDELKGMEYLPAQGLQTTPKLYVCFGRHYQYNRRETHGWTEIDLRHPNAKGPWFVGPESMVSDLNTNEYIFTIPKSWADQYCPGKRLACGRHRDGQEASGPSIIAFGPWNDGNPPPPGTELGATPLLLYEPWSCVCETCEGNQDGDCLDGHCEEDNWFGGAWLEDGIRSAVAIIGVKSYGDCWYGYPDGTRCPPTCECDDCGGHRGYQADYFRTVILLYDPNDLAAVAQGWLDSDQPQPYEIFDITPYMLQYPAPENKIKATGVAYDEERGLLFVTEEYGHIADYRPVIHVWQVQGAQGSSGDDTNPGEGDPSNPGDPGDGSGDGEGEEEAQTQGDVQSTTGPVSVFPNPSRGRTTIALDENLLTRNVTSQLRGVESVSSNAAIYDIRGRRVQDLGPVHANTVVWDASRLDAGIYFVGVKIGSEFYTRKITIVR
jgi:hypothetical protein